MIKPIDKETKSEYINRSVSYLISNGLAEDESNAIMIAGSFFDTFTDSKVIELTVDEQGIDAIALVEEPAIEIDFLRFSKNKKLVFAQVDEDRRIVTGPALVPDKMIFRIDEKTKESFYVYFSKETVRDISEKYLIQSNNSSVNIEHEFAVKDISIIESWIVEDPELDKSKKLGYSLPTGTWMVSFKINNDEVWNDLVKKDMVKGFSIEGAFIHNFKKEELSKEDKLIQDINNIISQID